MSAEFFKEISKIANESRAGPQGMFTVDIKDFAGNDGAIDELVSLCRQAWGRQDIGEGMKFLVNDQSDANIFITFAKNGDIIDGFCVYKVFNVNDKNILYIDNIAVLPGKRKLGLGTTFQLDAIEKVTKEASVDLILARTQNPLVESSLSTALQKTQLGWSLLCPLRTNPSQSTKEDVNKIIASGKIPKKSGRQDSRFDDESFIFWGAYGDGSGNTWEDMTKSANIDWTNPKTELFVKHLSNNGLTMEKFLNEEHALVLASEKIKKQYG